MRYAVKDEEMLIRKEADRRLGSRGRRHALLPLDIHENAQKLGPRRFPRSIHIFHLPLSPLATAPFAMPGLTGGMQRTGLDPTHFYGRARPDADRP
jgi:hypothetical protein